jgi:hypothetical protein
MKDAPVSSVADVQGAAELGPSAGQPAPEALRTVVHPFRAHRHSAAQVDLK